jgi:hypothetical protein
LLKNYFFSAVPEKPWSGAAAAVIWIQFSTSTTYNYTTTSTGAPAPKKSRDDIKTWVWGLIFFPGLIQVFVTAFTLNIYVMVPGFILFAIGVGLMSWEQGSHAAKQHNNNRHTSAGWSDVYMNGWGSYNAKRNVRQGYRYSKRK